MAEKERIYCMDGLKVLLCLLIFIHHYWGGVTNYGSFGCVPFETLLYPFYHFGALGVDLFFAISGFMICYNYKEKIRNISVVSFLQRRLTKLYPIAVLSVLVGFGFSLLNQTHALGIQLIDKPISMFHLILSVLLINNGWIVNEFNAYGSGTWFLNVLFLCYFVWACLYKLVASEKFGSGSNNRGYYDVTVAMIVAGTIFYYADWNVPLMFKVSGQGYMNFFLGVLLAELMEEKSKARISKAVVLCLLGTSLGIITFDPGCLVTFAVCPVCILLAMYFLPVKKFLSTKIFRLTSRYTMPIYLSHVFVIVIFIMVDRAYDLGLRFDHAITMLAVILVSCAVAWLLHRADSKLQTSILRRR